MLYRAQPSIESERSGDEMGMAEKEEQPSIESERSGDEMGMAKKEACLQKQILPVYVLFNIRKEGNRI